MFNFIIRVPSKLACMFYSLLETTIPWSFPPPWRTSSSVSEGATMFHQQAGTIAKDRDRRESRRVVVVIHPVILVIVDDAQFPSDPARSWALSESARSPRSEIVDRRSCPLCVAADSLPDRPRISRARAHAPTFAAFIVFLDAERKIVDF